MSSFPHGQLSASLPLPLFRHLLVRHSIRLESGNMEDALRNINSHQTALCRVAGSGECVIDPVAEVGQIGWRILSENQLNEVKVERNRNADARRTLDVGTAPECQERVRSWKKRDVTGKAIGPGEGQMRATKEQTNEKKAPNKAKKRMTRTGKEEGRR